jgi:probable metal-binding protein
MASIHGQLVLEMLLDEHRKYTKDTLKEEIVKRFGEDAIFHACAADNMSFDDLYTFLCNRGKISIQNGILSTARSHICDNE